MRDAGRTHGELFNEVPKLGPALTSSIPTPREGHGPPIELDVEADQNLNSKYVFSGTQRKLIKTGDVSDRSERNKGVLKKRDRLPDRLQQLIEDVALLHDTPYLSEDRWESGKVESKQTQSRWADLHRQYRSAEEWTGIEDLSPEEREVEQYESPFDGPSDLWEELISVDQRGQQVRDDVFFHGNSVASRETQFGYEIGNLLRILRPEHDEDVPGADLIWGFLLAFIGQSRDSLDQEREKLDELITVMRDNHDSRKKDAERAPDLDELNAFFGSARKVTAEGIEEAGFEPHPILVREVLHHQPVLEDETHHKNAVKHLVSKIADTVPLREVDQLYAQLTEDQSTLESRSVPGIESAQLVIEGHMAQYNSESPEGETGDDDTEEQEGETGPDDEETGASFEKEGNAVPELTTKKRSAIGKSIGVDESVVATILNRLSDEGNGELWTTRPIFKKKDDGWRPTPYGRLFAHVAHRRHGETDLLYWFALGPEEVTLYERKLIIEALNENEDISVSPHD
ncbi:hypothetical protein [Halalkaliarchaeum desulfuricum]|uniref:hypothetical protein n=1 Tax=Halalkaliarchaeum desulfuricum TaxID=2055893 RepID=UPI000E6D304F|nr:hypothetical protein [Halalkaliarchaeum desulfuricum]